MRHFTTCYAHQRRLRTSPSAMPSMPPITSPWLSVVCYVLVVRSSTQQYVVVRSSTQQYCASVSTHVCTGVQSLDHLLHNPVLYILCQHMSVRESGLWSIWYTTQVLCLKHDIPLTVGLQMCPSEQDSDTCKTVVTSYASHICTHPEIPTHVVAIVLDGLELGGNLHPLPAHGNLTPKYIIHEVQH